MPLGTWTLSKVSLPQRRFSARDQSRATVLYSLATVITSSVSALLIWTAVVKTLDPWPTLHAASLVLPDVIKTVGGGPAIGGLILVEFALAAFLVCSGRPRLAISGCVVLFLFFTAVLITLEHSGVAASCGCGMVSHESGEGNSFGVARNAIIVTLLIAAWVIGPCNVSSTERS